MASSTTDSVPGLPLHPTNTTPVFLPCDQYLHNMSVFLDQHISPGTPSNQTAAEGYHELATYIIQKVVVPIVCVFGILGNILNLVVLTRKQLQSSMDDMEKSAHLGLVALAVSDLLFCLLYLLVSLLSIQDKPAYTHHESIVTLYYNIYHEPLTNIALLSSTWLTVIMALGRYIGICHPLHARGFINLPGTRAAILGVFLGAILANLPKFWHYHLLPSQCSKLNPAIEAVEGTECWCYVYFKAKGSLYNDHMFELVYTLAYFILGLIVPLLLLTFCNICLIRALRQSYRMQRMYRANQPRDSGHRITPTLVTIIILFTILVTPSEILAFFKHYIISKRHGGDFNTFKTANTVANFALVTNFSINFVLYCVINVQFRKTVRDIMSCACRRGTQASPEYTKANHCTMTVNISDCETEM